MAGKMTRAAYEECILQDLDWLAKQPNSLEKRHITLIVERSINYEYPVPKIPISYDFEESKTK